MELTIYNKGDDAVRVIIDGDTYGSAQILAGEDADISAERTIEIRALGELSDDQKDGGQEPAVA